ncbi:hypothetical protein SODALDRAFT_319971 [Sodiomyces alkalinus F11]|uniref:Myb-like domain-containing protein n=1 Tax=Sodiomyces alkalinus (strain CBS 110278 / VKM F-3762 / F11) TaxID=1314773 RepID=A0A3N2Q9U8_SODAK|nr:hypothetical protein SODALDRAFT_319971 [Sodiomyces alkalinus F11]ROT43544.1 hypothetical protein SODALDRAFT_319971 [Sodiomyces alkalinus F11]
MSSKANKPSGRKLSQLTEKENEFIKAMFDNRTQRPDADWDKVADDLGLANAKCAKERFRQMSKKHGWGSGSEASPSKTRVSKPVSNQPRKARERPRKSKTSYTDMFSDSADSNGEPDNIKTTESDDEDAEAELDLVKNKTGVNQTTPTRKSNVAPAESSEPLIFPVPDNIEAFAPYEESELDEDDIARWADEF